MNFASIKLIFAVDAIVQPLTGIGRYAFELACRLPNLPQIQKVRFFDGFRLVPMPSAPVPRAQASRFLRAWALRTSWVADLLGEDAGFVADAIAQGRNLQRRCGIEKAGRQPAQPVAA